MSDAPPQRRRKKKGASAPCLTGALLHRRWRVGKALGRGGFGVTYRGLHVETRAPVAIKVEHPETSRKHRHNSPLKNEINMYAALHPCAGLPRVEWTGSLRAPGDKPVGLRVMVMELLGQSLERARAARPGGALPYGAALDVGRQLLRLLRHAHRRGVVHRDIKPDNIMFGREEYHRKVFLVDFGLAKRVKPEGCEHIPCTEGRRLTGSARYCSLATHRGYSQTYSDDLEMLAYTLICLHEGSLPWQGLPAMEDKEAHYRAIGEAKQAYRPPDTALGWLLRCARKLEYAQFPPYNEILAQFDAHPEEPDANTCSPWMQPSLKNLENGLPPSKKQKSPPPAPASCGSA